jgi:hypothetical protein
MKVKIENIVIGNFDVDSITVNINNVETQICFSKDIDVSKYNGKDVELIKKDGIYTITDITKK